MLSALIPSSTVSLHSLGHLSPLCCSRKQKPNRNQVSEREMFIRQKLEGGSGMMVTCGRT